MGWLVAIFYARVRRDPELGQFFVFLSVLLGCGLFAAAFFSDKSGHDQHVTDAARARDETSR